MIKEGKTSILTNHTIAKYFSKNTKAMALINEGVTFNLIYKYSDNEIFLNEKVDLEYINNASID